MERLRRELRFHPQQVRELRNAYLKSFASDEESLASFPAPERIDFGSLAIHQRHDSAQDGASKLLFRTSEGLLTEAVILRVASGRSTVCVSSQVGCAAACRFCATGTMGIARELSVAEILGHRSAAFTASRYAHVIASQHQEVADVMGDLLTDPEGQSGAKTG